MRIQAHLCVQAASIHMYVINIITTLLLFPLSTFLQATHENLYKYNATEDYFGDEKDQSFVLTVYFRMFCESSEIFSRILFLYAIACTKIKA